MLDFLTQGHEDFVPVRKYKRACAHWVFLVFYSLLAGKRKVTACVISFCTIFLQPVCYLTSYLYRVTLVANQYSKRLSPTGGGSFYCASDVDEIMSYEIVITSTREGECFVSFY
jgi:hypothetical protein